jgi:hypothetical protein
MKQGRILLEKITDPLSLFHNSPVVVGTSVTMMTESLVGSKIHRLIVKNETETLALLENQWSESMQKIGQYVEFIEVTHPEGGQRAMIME